MPNIDSGCALAVDDEIGIEDLVPAVLAVGLREHHQFDIGRVAAEPGEGRRKVVDLIGRQRQAPIHVGRFERDAATAEHIDVRHRHPFALVEQVPRPIALEGHALGHAVVQQGRGSLQLVGIERPATEQPCLHLQTEFGDAFDAVQREATVVCDVGGLAGPRRHGAQPRHHHHQHAVAVGRRGLAVGQQRPELVARGGSERRVAPGPVHMAGADAVDAWAGRAQARQQGLRPERRQGIAALEMQQMLGRSGHRSLEEGSQPQPSGHRGEGNDFTGRVG